MAIDPLSIFGFGVEMIKQIRSFVSPKIEIEPKHIKLPAPNDWNTTKVAVVSNKTDKPLFDIQIVLWTKGDKPKVNIELEEQEKGHQENIGGVDVNTDSFVVDGEKDGMFFRLLQISYISENSSRRLFISPEGATSIYLEAIKFSTQPGSLVKKENGVAIPFVPPFNMTLNSISLLLKKKP